MCRTQLSIEKTDAPKLPKNATYFDNLDLTEFVSPSRKTERKASLTMLIPKTQQLIKYGFYDGHQIVDNISLSDVRSIWIEILRLEGQERSW